MTTENRKNDYTFVNELDKTILRYALIARDYARTGMFYNLSKYADLIYQFGIKASSGSDNIRASIFYSMIINKYMTANYQSVIEIIEKNVIENKIVKESNELFVAIIFILSMAYYEIEHKSNAIYYFNLIEDKIMINEDLKEAANEFKKKIN